MQLQKLLFFIGLTLFTTTACSDFDLGEEQEFPTYLKNFGSSTFDVGFDAIVVDSATYFVIGASGLEALNAHGFIAKIEKSSGAFSDYKVIRNDDSRNQALLNIIKTTNENTEYQAVGLSANMSDFSDGEMLSVRFNQDLQDIQLDHNLSSSGFGYNQSNNLARINDNQVLIVGQRKNQVGVVLAEEQGMLTDALDHCYPGQFTDLIVDTLTKKAICVGFESRQWNPAVSRRAIISIFDYQQNEFVCCREDTLYCTHPADTIGLVNAPSYLSSQYLGVVQMEDETFFAIGGVGNVIEDDDFRDNGRTLLTKFRVQDNQLEIIWTKIYETEFGFNNAARGIVADGNDIVITGRRAINNNTDLLIAKLDSNGEILWQRSYDSGNKRDDFGWSILKDEGFFIVGQTKDNSTAQPITSVLLVKTDAMGKIENK